MRALSPDCHWRLIIAERSVFARIRLVPPTILVGRSGWLARQMGWKTTLYSSEITQWRQVQSQLGLDKGLDNNIISTLGCDKTEWRCNAKLNFKK